MQIDQMRRRLEECRRQAASVAEEHGKEMLLSAARTWEKLIEQEEALEAERHRLGLDPVVKKK